MNVLVVDDTELNRKLLRVLLDAEGFSVIEAADGLEAIDLLKKNAVDLVITDILMPNMDGYRLCYEIRVSEEFYTIPIIIYTSTYTSKSDEELSLKMGADKFLKKPASTEDILSSIKEVAGKSRTVEYKPLPQEVELMKKYSQQLVSKLEKKNTELQIRTEQLIEAHEKLNHLLACSPTVIYALDIEGANVSPSWVSENLIDVTGFKSDEANTYSWWVSRLHEDDRDIAIDSIAKVLEQGQNSESYRIQHKDGSFRWILDDKKLSYNAENKPSQIIGSWTDITEKRNLEQQLLRAQRMDGLGSLAGGIAHDLNNALAPVMMASQILRPRIQDEKSQKMLGTIQTSVQRAADMVRQILTFSRGAEGEKGPLQLTHILTEIVEICAQTFPKTIQLNLEVPKDLYVVLADPTQLHQVLLNLCVNSRDAMPEGGTLQVKGENFLVDYRFASTCPDAKSGSYVLITVRDTGMGIPHEIMNKIFEPFFTTKEIGKGTGLGLSMVSSIVKNHGGFVTLESKVGSGTVFKVFLPALTKTETASSKMNQTELPQGNGEWVLVVDDEATLREMTRTTLETYGYQVLLASNGAEAVALSAQNVQNLKVGLVDMMMPVMDGEATISALQMINPHLKIIAASGLAQAHRISLEHDKNVFALLEKPYSADQLIKTLHRVLNGEKIGL